MVWLRGERMLKAKTRWDILTNDHEKIELLSNELNIAPLVASLLISRGFNTIETAKAFLFTENQDFHDPFLLDDMEKTVNRINQAILNNERILVYGDYDADGVSSTTVLMTVLTDKGANVDFYIPNRFTEGYGPNENAFRWAKDEGYTLIITVDTGISALHEADVAKELGIDLVITDHHEPGPILPDAFSIIHPKKDSCPYPFKELAGVGVAFKLAHALLGQVPTSLLEIAAIGTIADLVPLHGENRLLASKGISMLQTSNRVGIKALLKVCGIESNEITEETIGFALAPRINAVGRLEDADPAVHLLMTNDREEADMLAEQIDLLNKQRQQLVNDMTEEAIKEVEELYPPDKNSVLVIAKEGWNAGVVGIVASRLVDRFYRPTIVLSIDSNKGIAKGSARSIAGFDLFANLSTCRDILPHFGGHPMAAGMTLNLEDVDLLRSRLNHLAGECLTKEDFIPITNVDVVCSLHDVTIDTITQLNRLAPFGMSNPKPRVLIKDATLNSIRRIGSNQSHLKIVLEDEGVTLDGVGFGFGEVYDHISPVSKLSILGELSINEWNNFRKPQVMIQDVAVNHWQLFDYRGTKDIHKVIDGVPSHNRKLVVFNQDTLNKLQLGNYNEEVIVLSSSEKVQLNLSSSHVILIDLPTSKNRLHDLFKSSFPERIYTLFYNQHNHFFSTIPTREHFKWFYAFLTKRGSFDIKRYGMELAKRLGWSIETIDFMSQVFFELEFVKIDNGIISLSTIATKRDLIESETYRLKQEQLELENEYLYSSYQQLKQLFDQFHRGSLTYEEAVN
jgi:single-stranded-DNA-specific exonuclease